MMNKNLIDVKEIEHLLPKRKSNRKTELKMSALSTSWDPEDKFEYPKNEYTQDENRKINC